MRPLEAEDPAAIGRYRLLGVLGSGGMGRVYLGQTGEGRTVAVKVVRPDLAGDNTFRTRFQREVAAARRVSGRYTVPVLDAEVDVARPWLATGYVPGPSLTDAVENHGPLPEQSLLALTAGLARALVDVHAAGMVHRDLKPSNVLLAADGPRVIDFGIARAADDTALTTTGKVIGSPGYMCPEQITGREPMGPAGDVFSLGGLLVYAATGRAPFGTGDSASMLWRVVQEEPGLDGVPGSLRPMVAHCLSKDARSRPTATDLAHRCAALATPGGPGWLPRPILDDIDRRAADLLDLETAPARPRATPPPPRTLPAPSGTTTTSPGTAPPPPETAVAPRGTTRLPHNAIPGASGSGPAPSGTGWRPQEFVDTVVRPGGSPPTGSAPDSLAGARNPARRNRLALVLGGAAAAVILAAGVAVGLVVRDDTPAARPGISAGVPAAATRNPGPKPAGTTEATPSNAPSSHTPSSGALPRKVVGTWKGTATDGAATYDVVVTLKAGKTGDELGTANNTGRGDQGTCKRAETLTDIGDSVVTLRARTLAGATTGKGCREDGRFSTLRLNRDGSATYLLGLDGGDLTGILHRGG
ncbi:serine/threonine-protein kinase [Nocardia sp. BMG51109]|uniref:serine/threonine-protein kinase n=1 Tax=Nocardia sp. BMG51109 TaxID=1056816 RepID=UPI0004654C2F|nr:serine/threonine-protein kinase [Nocardia sp. BMG51109]